MEIKPHQITIRELFEDYADMGEEGVFGYGDRLNIRPPYQRELVYDAKEQADVIDSVRKGFPINVMYWMDNEDGTYELLDGQQRTLSICRYVDGEYPIEVDGSTKFYDNLTPDEKKQILDYVLTIYFCVGTDTERLAWFKIINIAGKKLTDQELRNAVYNGPWVTAAKKVFSKTNCYAYNLGRNYIRGDSIRQEIFETVLQWACDADDIETIEKYMAIHQHDSDAKKLKQYFTDIIDWIETVFTEYHPKMKGLPWGLYYNKYRNKVYDAGKVKARVRELMDDPEVTKYAGVLSISLAENETLGCFLCANLTNPQSERNISSKRAFAPCVAKNSPYDKMHGDHIKPWTDGGTTTIDNCQMLCAKCNLAKGATEADFS